MEKTKKTAPLETFSQYASIILDRKLPKLLDYGVPMHLLGKLQVGQQVEVLLRGRKATGFIHSLKTKANYPKVLPLLRLVKQEIVLHKELFDLALWMQSYYSTPLSKIIRCMIPKVIRKDLKEKTQTLVTPCCAKLILEKKAKELERQFPSQARVLQQLSSYSSPPTLQELMRDAKVSQSPIKTLEKKKLLLLEQSTCFRSSLLHAEYFPSQAKKLTSEQASALSKIATHVDQKSFCTHLLFGITGSGKTEVYLQAIEKVLKEERQVLILVPEVALTSQTIERFKSRFDLPIAALHSRLSEGQRRDEWVRISKGEVPIVIGARSAIFSPLTRLGLIIVDEEHETSYKNETAPFYNARDLAIMRAKIHSCPVLLGSATPSIESYYQAKQGKYLLSVLSKRPTSHTLPKVRIIDMKAELEKGYYPLSSPLLNSLEERLKKGEQSILFLNRRGFHTSLLCSSCDKVFSCPHCSLSLTYHKKEQLLRCHLCGYSLNPPKVCPDCDHETLDYKGIGTERLEKSLYALFPQSRILRMDADTTQKKGQLEQLLQKFRTHKADILLGTQMIAKGHHFPGVSLVGVLQADGPLHLPDFRSSEYAFQLLTQVAGRAGRGEIPGEVLIQSFLPSHSTITHAAKQDYPGFFEEELSSRQFFHYPPFVRIIKLTLSSKNESLVKNKSKQLFGALCQSLPTNFILNEACPAGYQKVLDYYRFQILVRGNAISHFHRCLSKILQKEPLPSSIRLSIDVDPSSTFF